MKILASVISLLAMASVASAQGITYISTSSINNARLQSTAFTGTSGISLPGNIATVGSGDVQFTVNGAGNNAWNSYLVSGSSPRTVDLNVGVYGVTQAYTLLNTYWGQAGHPEWAYVEFIGTGGNVYRKNLTGDVDIRNYNADPVNFTKTVNGTSTKQVLSYNAFDFGQRMDMQTYDLPSAFATDTLQTIRFYDAAPGFEQQYLFLSGVAVRSNGPSGAVPEPGEWAAFGVLGLGLGGLVIRKRKLA